MQGGMRADSSPGWALDVGRSTGPLLWGSGVDIRSATLTPLYLLHSVSWLRGWRGRGGGLEVRGGTARAAVDGLGRMGWRAWMAERVSDEDGKQVRDVDGGRMVLVGMGEERWVLVPMNTGGT